MKLLEQLLNMYDYARTDATAIVDDNGDEALLAEQYGRVVEAIQKRSNVQRVKAQGLGDASAGSMVFSRFQNASVEDYGTARTALAGDALIDDQVTVNLDEYKEIVEELDKRDVKQHGIPALISRRVTNHALRMQAHLDRAALEAAFDAAANVGNDSDVTADDYLEALENIIVEVETVTNDNVDGVPRDQIVVFLAPSVFGKIRKELDTLPAFNGTTADEVMTAYHGAYVLSEHYLPTGTDFIATTVGNIAQPIYSEGYSGGDRIPLTNAVEISMFFNYGVKILAEDLVFEGEIVIGEVGL
jgi:hypothetical protein